MSKYLPPESDDEHGDLWLIKYEDGDEEHYDSGEVIRRKTIKSRCFCLFVCLVSACLPVCLSGCAVFLSCLSMSAYVIAFVLDARVHLSACAAHISRGWGHRSGRSHLFFGPVLFVWAYPNGVLVFPFYSLNHEIVEGRLHT